MEKTALYALTPQGASLGQTLADKLHADLFLPGRLAHIHDALPFDGLTAVVARNFAAYPRHVFIAASGIVVRAVAPLLSAKDRDPAVIVLDQKGEYVISLVSGHLGGANQLARQVAQLTGGKAVITTATDTAMVPAIDVLAKERNLGIANLKAVRTINMTLLEGRPVQIFDPGDELGLKGEVPSGFTIEWVETEDQWINGRPGVWVTWKDKRPDPESDQLVLHPRRLIAGIGCNRGTSDQEILSLITKAFDMSGLSLRSLACLATIEAKRDEPGLLKAAKNLKVPLVFAGRSPLESIEVPHPSSTVKRHMGVSSVCEAAALLTSGRGRLLVPKTKSPNATLAVALED